MKIKEKELVEFLINYVKGDELSEKLMEDAHVKKNMWDKGEWIYVKDLEVSIKKLVQYLSRNKIDEDIVFETITGLEGDQSLCEDELIVGWLCDIRNNLRVLYGEDGQR